MVEALVTEAVPEPVGGLNFADDDAVLEGPDEVKARAVCRGDTFQKKKKKRCKANFTGKGDYIYLAPGTRIGNAVAQGEILV